MQVPGGRWRGRASSGVASFAPRHKTALMCLLLFLVVWKTFVPCLDDGFVNYDDPAYVYDNPHVTSGLTWRNVLWAFSSSTVANWHPLTMLTHVLDWQLYGTRPWGHHLA